jgi:hypothetical protein
MTTTLSSSNAISARHILRALLIAAIFIIAGTSVLAYQVASTDEFVELERGDVAPKDILAPRQIVYESASETEAARERAKNNVPTIYSPPNTHVARQQVTRLSKIFDYMDTVRADPYASLSEKFEWIEAIPDLTLSETVIDQILIMDDQAWTDTRQEALAILNEAMRSEIRENQVTTTRRQLPTKVALDTPDEQASVIVAITEDLIKANTFPDEVRTEAERQAAIDAVEPVMRTIKPGELIISGGQRVGPKEYEALQAVDFEQPQSNPVETLVAPIILILLTTIIVSIYLLQYTPKILTDTKRLILLVLLLLIFIGAAKFMVLYSPALIYLYPIAAFAMLASIFIDAQLAFMLSTILAFLAGSVAGDGATNIVIYLILSGWTGALVLGRGQQVNALLWATVYVSIANTIIITIFNFSAAGQIFSSLGTLIIEGVLNGILSAGLALLGLFIIGHLFGIITTIQLTELERPTQPLLRQLLTKAPGTYHHSLMVGNLAQQAAERIGANSALVRVMALYHDIGKMHRPYFFIENQPEGMANVHEKLDPQVSAKIIISHVADGLDLARKYRLPQAIKDGIAQHHGASLVRFFYYQALEAAKEKGAEVNEAKFRYPGPRPQSKENGILMLADISETTVRALKPTSAEEIDEIVRKSITHHLESGQLDECDLTIADLRKVRAAFVDILQGVHHPRIKYPSEDKEEEETSQLPIAQPEPTKSSKKPAPVAAPQPLNSIPATPSSQPARLVRRE